MISSYNEHFSLTVCVLLRHNSWVTWYNTQRQEHCLIVLIMQWLPGIIRRGRTPPINHVVVTWYNKQRQVHCLILLIMQWLLTCGS